MRRDVHFQKPCLGVNSRFQIMVSLLFSRCVLCIFSICLHVCCFFFLNVFSHFDFCHFFCAFFHFLRVSDSTTPQLNHQQTCPRAQSCTHAPTTHARAGALVFSSSCLDESISRVGPGQYPQNEPNNTLHETSKSRMVAEPWVVRPWQWWCPTPDHVATNVGLPPMCTIPVASRSVPNGSDELLLVLAHFACA